MQNTPTVYVVDDDSQARRSVCALVQSMGLAAREFPSAEAFLAKFSPGSPGCLVTDVRMLGMSGLELQDELNRRGIRLPVIVLTAHSRTPLTVRAMQAGAVTLLDKPYQQDELWDAIRKALARDMASHGETARRAELRRRLASLTASERAVMDRIVQGKPNKVIASELGVSLRTVEHRRHEVLRKTCSESVAELVRMAIEADLDGSPSPSTVRQ